MITDALTFIFITLCYMLIVTPVFVLLFQEESLVYVDIQRVLVSLFDAMLGNYSYSVKGDKEI